MKRTKDGAIWHAVRLDEHNRFIDGLIAKIEKTLEQVDSKTHSITTGSVFQSEAVQNVYCTKCGAKATISHNYCGRCGERLPV